MDSKTLAHVSGELIAFAGLAVYFQRKCSFLEDRIKKLEDENVDIIDNMENLNQSLVSLTDMLRGKVSQPQQHHHHKQQQQPVSRTVSTAPVSSVSSISPIVSSSQVSASSPTVSSKKEPDSESESLSNDPDLKKELERIEKEREGNCEGGVCKI
jgi:hypothetical protein